MLLWETAVAVAGRLIGINPFDQPDVESAKKAARELLAGGSDRRAARRGVRRGRRVRHHGIHRQRRRRRAARPSSTCSTATSSVQAYLDRIGLAEYAGLREVLARRTGRPVTFGWGPRFLHSTGQYHKGGPGTGVYLQLTSDPVDDLPVPGRDFTFGEFIASQAAGDAHVLREHGRPVLRLHLADAVGRPARPA